MTSVQFKSSEQLLQCTSTDVASASSVSDPDLSSSSSTSSLKQASQTQPMSVSASHSIKSLPSTKSTLSKSHTFGTGSKKSGPQSANATITSSLAGDLTPDTEMETVVLSLNGSVSTTDDMLSTPKRSFSREEMEMDTPATVGMPTPDRMILEKDVTDCESPVTVPHADKMDAAAVHEPPKPVGKSSALNRQKKSKSSTRAVVSPVPRRRSPRTRKRKRMTDELQSEGMGEFEGDLSYAIDLSLAAVSGSSIDLTDEPIVGTDDEASSKNEASTETAEQLKSSPEAAESMESESSEIVSHDTTEDCESTPSAIAVSPATVAETRTEQQSSECDPHSMSDSDSVVSDADVVVSDDDQDHDNHSDDIDESSSTDADTPTFSATVDSPPVNLRIDARTLTFASPRPAAAAAAAAAAPATSPTVSRAESGSNDNEFVRFFEEWPETLPAHVPSTTRTAWQKFHVAESKYRPAQLIFPASSSRKRLKLDLDHVTQVTDDAAVTLAACLEYVTAEIIEISQVAAKKRTKHNSGNGANDSKQVAESGAQQPVMITERDVETAFNCDDELRSLFHNDFLHAREAIPSCDPTTLLESLVERLHVVVAKAKQTGNSEFADAYIAPPASEADIDTAEARLGFNFGHTFRCFLRLANGVRVRELRIGGIACTDTEPCQDLANIKKEPDIETLFNLRATSSFRQMLLLAHAFCICEHDADDDDECAFDVLDVGTGFVGTLDLDIWRTAEENSHLADYIEEFLLDFEQELEIDEQLVSPEKESSDSKVEESVLPTPCVAESCSSSEASADSDSESDAGAQSESEKQPKFDVQLDWLQNLPHCDTERTRASFASRYAYLLGHMRDGTLDQVHLNRDDDPFFQA
jgi:hypothetical protein